MTRLIGLMVLVFCFSGCAAMNEKQWNRWPAMQQEKPVAILTVVEAEPGVPEHATEYFFTSLPTLIANSGYYALPPSFSTQLLRDSGYKETGSVRQAQEGTVHTLTGADAVLYVNVREWGATTSVFGLGTVRVAASYQLVSTKTGAVLWHADQYHEVDTTVEEGGWVASMILTELETASTDITELARQLNESVLLSLPPGKYNPEYQNWLKTTRQVLVQASEPK
jgi:hypothetical protein